MEDIEIVNSAVILSPNKRPVPYVAQLFDRCVVHCWPCRRPTKKTVAVSDIDLQLTSQQPKEKTSARLETPIVSTDDESDSNKQSNTPKAKGRTDPQALEKNKRYLLSISSLLHCVR